MQPLKVSEQFNPPTKESKDKEWTKTWIMRRGCACGVFDEVPAVDLRRKEKK